MPDTELRWATPSWNNGANDGKEKPKRKQNLKGIGTRIVELYRSNEETALESLNQGVSSSSDGKKKLQQLGGKTAQQTIDSMSHQEQNKSMRCSLNRTD